MGSRLADKVALITGAARGMGAAQAEQFVAEGARVVVADILDDAGRQLSERLGDAASYVHLDVGSEEEWNAAVKAALDTFGAIDILVNNAGVYRRASFEELTMELIDFHYRVNQLGVFLGLRAVFAHMKDRGAGSIINVSSISGLGALPGHAAYGTTKWAVRGLTKYAAVEFGQHGIRVNSTHPGFIDTVMLDENSPEVNDGIPDVTPLGRKGTVNELAEVTLFLASDASSYVNGAEIAVDGGTSI